MPRLAHPATLLALLLPTVACKTVEPPAKSRPPFVRPKCEFEVQPVPADEPLGPFTPRTLAELLSGDYRILITWIRTEQHQDIHFSLAVQPDDTLAKRPTNEECYKPLTYGTRYTWVEQDATQNDTFVITPIMDPLPRMRHHLRPALVPETALPPEASDPHFIEQGWRLDFIELSARWHPSEDRTVAMGKITAWYRRDGDEPGITSAPIGLAAIYPEAAFETVDDPAP